MHTKKAVSNDSLKEWASNCMWTPTIGKDEEEAVLVLKQLVLSCSKTVLKIRHASKARQPNLFYYIFNHLKGCGRDLQNIP